MLPLELTSPNAPAGWWWPRGVDPPQANFNAVILKVSSRCNLNCSYCYVYNSADQRWRSQPTFMQIDVVAATAYRILQYAETHGLERFSIVLHGGEPLLLGHDRLDECLKTLVGELTPRLQLSIGLQTNGTLLDKRFIDIFRKHRIRIGLSIDGPPEWQDRHRVDHRGGGSAVAVEKALNLLVRAPDVFSGALCVVDLNNNPLDVYNYLVDAEIPSLDFLLPDANHTVLPPSVRVPLDAERYAEWLRPIFLRWYDAPDRPAIKLFTSVMRLLLGFRETVDSLGGGSGGYLVVEANGDIEGLDSLKSCYEGATQTGLTVLEHTFDEAAQAPVLRFGTLGAAGLCAECQSCQYVQVCGGGYVINRYRSGEGFVNPSIYCSGLMKLITTIAQRMYADFEDAGLGSPPLVSRLAFPAEQN
jgi:uncharacterized protein